MSALENVTHRVIQQQNGKSYSTFPHCLPIQQPHSAHSSVIHFSSCSSFSKKAQYLGNVRCKDFMHIPEFGVPHIMMRFFVVAYLQCITSYSKAYHQWAQNDTELSSSLTSMCELFDETHVNYLLLVGSYDHEA